MSVERTFSIVKPDAVESGHAGEILAIVAAEPAAQAAGKLAG